MAEKGMESNDHQEEQHLCVCVCLSVCLSVKWSNHVHNLRKSDFGIIFDFEHILSQMNHLELIYDDIYDNP